MQAPVKEWLEIHSLPFNHNIGEKANEISRFNPAKGFDDRILERPYARFSVMRGSSGKAFMERGWFRGRRTDVERRLDKRREDMRAADASQVKQASSICVMRLSKRRSLVISDPRP